MIRAKICGVTSSADARAAADAGADAVGLNFYSKSPRFIDPHSAGQLVRALPPFTSAVGVFVGTPVRQACAIAFQLGLRGLQTYSETPPEEDTFPFAHIPAFRVRDAASLESIRAFVVSARAAGRIPSAVLVDAFVEGQHGGTGQSPPWALVAGFDPGVPLILAGGLTPENVAEAIHTVRPWGVDVASGVESSPGRKDPDKVRAFIAKVRAASAELHR
jgi:phosphoribosylanthranilate isomerase